MSTSLIDIQFCRGDIFISKKISESYFLETYMILPLSRKF